MAVWVRYDSFILRQHNGSAINFDSGGDALKVALLTSAYTPDAAAHEFVDPDLDLGTNEVSGTNYASGGETVSGKTLAVASSILTFDCDDVSWLQDVAGFTDARIAVLYMDSGTPGTSPLIAYADMGTDQSNAATDLVLGTPSGVFTT